MGSSRRVRGRGGSRALELAHGDAERSAEAEAALGVAAAEAGDLSAACDHCRAREDLHDRERQPLRRRRSAGPPRRDKPPTRRQRRDRLLRRRPGLLPASTEAVRAARSPGARQPRANLCQLHLRLGDNDAARDGLRGLFSASSRDGSSLDFVVLHFQIEADRRITFGERPSGLQLLGRLRRLADVLRASTSTNVGTHPVAGRPVHATSSSDTWTPAPASTSPPRSPRSSPADRSRPSGRGRSQIAIWARSVSISRSRAPRSSSVREIGADPASPNRHTLVDEHGDPLAGIGQRRHLGEGRGSRAPTRRRSTCPSPPTAGAWRPRRRPGRVRRDVLGQCHRDEQRLGGGQGGGWQGRALADLRPEERAAGQEQLGGDGEPANARDDGV